jgi:hypothetical protein
MCVNHFLPWFNIFQHVNKYLEFNLRSMKFQYYKLVKEDPVKHCTMYEIIYQLNNIVYSTVYTHSVHFMI